VCSQANFYEAAVQGIDVKNKTVTACFPDDNLANVKGMSAACFQLEYDILVLGTSITLSFSGGCHLPRVRSESGFAGLHRCDI